MVNFRPHIVQGLYVQQIDSYQSFDIIMFVQDRKQCKQDNYSESWQLCIHVDCIIYIMGCSTKCLKDKTFVIVLPHWHSQKTFHWAHTQSPKQRALFYTQSKGNICMVAINHVNHESFVPVQHSTPKQHMQVCHIICVLTTEIIHTGSLVIRTIGT